MPLSFDGVDSPRLRVLLGVAPTAGEDDPTWLRLGGSRGPTRFGAFLDGSALGTSGWTAAASEWLALTGIPLTAGRWYAGTTYTIGTTLTQMTAAGVRICLDLAPPYNPVSSTDRTSIASMLATLKASGADVQVSLWHEPFFGGLTAAQYTAMIAYYGPTVRQYFPLWAVFSGNDTVEANGYFPGASAVDGVAADCYATSTANLDNCADLADKYGLPLGLWEFNAANDFGIDPSPVNGNTNAQGNTFLTYVRDLFAARVAAGKPNGDVLVFSSTGTTTGTVNFLGSGRSQDGGFEGGIGNWVAGTGATAAPSSAQAHSGSGSLLLTCTTAGTISAAHCQTANVTTQGLPVTAGQTVAFSCWARPGSTARFFQPGVLFYNSSGTFLSTSFASALIETAGAWTFNSGTAVAPASAAFAKLNPQITSVALSEQHYLEDPQIGVLPASTDHTAPVQYSWDYRIPALASIRAALDPVVGLGTGKLGGISWFDASSDLMSYSRQSGQGREDESATAATATFELENVSGLYDPLPSVADPGSTLPFTLPATLRRETPSTGGLAIDVGSPVWVIADFAGVSYSRFYGYIDEITPTLSKFPTVTIAASDGLEVLGRTKLAAVAATRDNDLSGARLGWILDRAEWPTSRRAIDAGRAHLQAATLGDFTLPLLQQVVDTELGMLFVDGDGKVTFYDRYHVYSDPRSTTVQATISDSGTDVDMVSVTVSKGRSTLFNQAAITRDGGVEQVYDDLPSQDQYKIRTYPGSPGALLRSDAEALDMARWLVNKFRAPDLRVTEVQVEALAQGVWTQVLNLRPLDLVRIVRNYGPSTLDVQLWVEALSEDVVPFERWDLTISTRQTNKFIPLVLGGTKGLGVGQLGL